MNVIDHLNTRLQFDADGCNFLQLCRALRQISRPNETLVANTLHLVLYKLNTALKSGCETILQLQFMLVFREIQTFTFIPPMWIKLLGIGISAIESMYNKNDKKSDVVSTITEEMCLEYEWKQEQKPLTRMFQDDNFMRWWNRQDANTKMNLLFQLFENNDNPKLHIQLTSALAKTQFSELSQDSKITLRFLLGDTTSVAERPLDTLSFLSLCLLLIRKEKIRQEEVSK